MSSGINARNIIVRCCRDIISEKIDMISGARLICRHYKSVSKNEGNEFDDIIGFESETDDYPIGLSRKSYTDTQLLVLDREYQNYISISKENIFSSCKKIIEMYE